MDEQQAAKSVADQAPSLGQGIGFVLTGIGGYFAKHLWDKRKPVRAGVSHADFQEVKDLLEKLRVGQDARGQQMAVIEATMATKEDLAHAVGEMTEKAREIVESAHGRISDHLRDHSKSL